MDSVTRSDNEAILAVAEQFGITVETTSKLLQDSIEELRMRDLYQAEPNCLNPAIDAPRYPLGTPRILTFNINPYDSYVGILTKFQAKDLVLSEPENGIRSHPTFLRYMEMRSAGFEPPYISVFEQVTGSGATKYVSANRRRALVAQERNETIVGWLEPENHETGLPLKYGDVIRAYEKCCAENTVRNRLKRWP